MTQESVEGQMFSLAEQAMGSDRIVSVEEVLKMVDSVTTEEVNAVSTYYYGEWEPLHFLQHFNEGKQLL